jgi:DNA polymerase-3 subunit gamma/tau
MDNSYLVIARRYRPQLFADVVGQEAVVRTLQNAFRSNRVCHAYLFSGSRGTGKTSIARLYAKLLNCASPLPSGEPCNSCPSCLEIAEGRSLDVQEVDGASNRGIDHIRSLTDSVSYAPTGGRYKIYLIDEVHMLTK